MIQKVSGVPAQLRAAGPIGVTSIHTVIGLFVELVVVKEGMELVPEVELIPIALAFATSIAFQL